MKIHDAKPGKLYKITFAQTVSMSASEYNTLYFCVEMTAQEYKFYKLSDNKIVKFSTTFLPYSGILIEEIC